MKLLATLAAVAAALLIAIQGGRAETMSARLAQNLGPISGIVLVAEQQGLFAKHGLTITVSNFTNGKQCLDTVVGGGADIATTAEAPTTAAMMADQPIAFLARMEYSDDKTLVATAAKIDTIADLKGKRIGFTPGTGSEIYTTTLLQRAHLAPTDVTLVNLRPQDMVAALAAGSIDAYDTWEPYISNGIKVLGAKVKPLDTKGVYSETFNIVVTQDYLHAHPKLIEAFLASMIEAETWIKANQEAAITVIAKTVGMKRDDLAPIWHDYVYHVALDQKQLDVLDMHAKWRLATNNHPPGATMPDLKKFIFPQPLLDVAPDRVTLPAGWTVAHK